MHYSRHRLTTSVTYMTTLAYASTNDQWARSACPLVGLSETKSCRFSLVQFSYVALYASLGNSETQRVVLEAGLTQPLWSVVQRSSDLSVKENAASALWTATQADVDQRQRVAELISSSSSSSGGSVCSSIRLKCNNGCRRADGSIDIQSVPCHGRHVTGQVDGFQRTACHRRRRNRGAKRYILLRICQVSK